MIIDLKYRTEIDGLRALAIISVVIYHFFPHIMPSGFLGVDIFFVISGYLITNHFISLQKNNKINSLRIFYSRRIKRLLPALFIFFTITTLVITNIFLNSDINKYGSSLLAAKTFWSNFYFWRDGGYFGTSDQLKPLLHIWSLSVEEQFYILYPTFILISIWITKKFKLPIIYLVFILTLLSFLLWLYLHHMGGANPAFFLLPTRAWQFGLGGFLVFIKLRSNSLKTSTTNIFIIASVLALFFGLIVNTNTIIQTIMVSLGATFFIYFSFKSKVPLLWIFQNIFTVWIGRISYSIYLYHWPIAVILFYYFIDSPPFFMSVIGIFLSLILGYLSYKYIETPFRRRFTLTQTILLILICSLISLSAIKLANQNKSESFIEKWSVANGSNYRCPVSSYYLYGASSRACVVEEGLKSKPTIAIFGNSHAQMYTPLIAEAIKNKGYKGILIPMNGCLPTIRINLSNECINIASNTLYNILDDKNIKHVFLSMTWYRDNYTNISGELFSTDELFGAIIDIINQLKISGKSVSVMSPIAIPNFPIASELPRKFKFNHLSLMDIKEKTYIDRKIFNSKFDNINNELKRYLGNNYIEVFNDLCDSNYCYFAKDELMYFADSDHLSQYSLKSLYKTQAKIERILDNLPIK
ncbi:acyltransferase [Candidatus Pelagibacter sp.]|nr:acyltransferase [Candidatus Pelagibacter sp.]